VDHDCFEFGLRGLDWLKSAARCLRTFSSEQHKRQGIKKILDSYKETLKETKTYLSSQRALLDLSKSFSCIATCVAGDDDPYDPPAVQKRNASFFN
jgi:hypothetical protein